MKKHLISFLVVCLVLSTSLTSGSNQNEKSSDGQPRNILGDGPMNSSWPMFGHDPRHTGRSPYSTANNLGRIKWKFETKWWISTSPIIDMNNTIYIASWNTLFAVYPTGTEKWHWNNSELYESSPAIAEDGTIYIGTENGYLFAINANGTTKWMFQANDGIHCAPTIDNDGTIYFCTFAENGKFYAVNPNGTEKWHYDADFYCHMSPAIGDDGTIYFNSHVYLYSFYANGTLKWKLKLGDPNFTFLGAPSVGDDGTIYIPCDPSFLYAIYPNGTIKWRCDTEWGSWAAPSIGLDGTIYIGYKHMFAFYPNGTLKWVFIPDGDEWHSIDSKTYALSSDGTIYIGTMHDSQNCYLIAVNPDGTEKWRQWISNERALSSPAIASDGTVYIGSYMNDGGALYAFGIGDYEADANGPYFGLTTEPKQLQGEGRNGTEPYRYYWDFGDGNISNEQNPQVIYTKPGNYTITFTVTDTNNNITTDTTWAWIQKTNTPPSTPTLQGPMYGKRGISYTYDFTSTDPDGSIVYYTIRWGDGRSNDWFGPFNSGDHVNQSHVWDMKLPYTISVKAKDPYGAESEWTTLKVHMSDIWIRLTRRFIFATVIIRNSGSSPLYNVTWKILFYKGVGGVLFSTGGPSEGTIPVLHAFTAKRIPIFLTGLGLIDIVIKAMDETKLEEVFAIGPFFFFGVPG